MAEVSDVGLLAIAEAINKHTEAVHVLAERVREVAYGSKEPGGLEAVAMALGYMGDPGGPDTIGGGLHAVAEVLERIAEHMEKSG